jgi:PDZ domain-containing protein
MAGSSVTDLSMSDFNVTTDGDAAAPSLPPDGAAPARGPRPVWQFAVLALVLVVIIGSVVLSKITTNDYAIAPGQAQPVTPFIKVPATDNHTLHGRILLTDVYLLGPLNGWSYIWDSLNSDDVVQPESDLLGTTPEPQYLAQGYLDMSQSQSDATAAALTHLGYHVSAQNAGVLIYGIGTGVPAAKVLKVGQVITKVNGVATPTECDLFTALHGLLPGSTATLGVEQSYLNDAGTFVPGPVVAKSVLLGKAPKAAPITGCGAPITQTALIGIQPEQQLTWSFPVKVSVHIADIGGPSAGLAMALGIIDKLSGGHLTGNRTIAATGAIVDPQGDVGDVGGVAQKTIAVERAGATVFFVPPQELAAAKSKDDASLHVYAVSTLDQALKILEHLGGSVSANHLQAQAAP